MGAPPPKSLSGAKPQPIGGFTRRLTDDSMLIESRCQFCGVVIVGSVLHGLREEENAHQANCPAAKTSRRSQ